MRSSLLLVALVSLAVPADLAAADCAAEVDRLAGRYQLGTNLPQSTPPRPDGRGEVPATTESRGIPPEAMQESGGVIAPPSTGRTPVIQPPTSTGSPMPTTPNVPPQTAEGAAPKAGDMDAAKRAQLQSLLTAAKAAATQQREAECFRQLGEARALSDTLPPATR